MILAAFQIFWLSRLLDAWYSSDDNGSFGGEFSYDNGKSPFSGCQPRLVDIIYIRESDFGVDSCDFKEESDLPDSDSDSSSPTPPHAPPPEWADTVIEPPDIPYVNYVNMEHVCVKNKDTCGGFSAIELFSLFFTEYALKLIVEHTNLYQQQCQAKGLNHLPWSALTVPEFKT